MNKTGAGILVAVMVAALMVLPAAMAQLQVIEVPTGMEYIHIVGTAWDYGWDEPVEQAQVILIFYGMVDKVSVQTEDELIDTVPGIQIAVADTGPDGRYEFFVWAYPNSPALIFCVHWNYYPTDPVVIFLENEMNYDFNMWVQTPPRMGEPS